MPVASLEGHSAALLVAFPSFPCLPRSSVVASTRTPFPLSPTVGWGHEPLPRGEVRVTEVPGTLSQRKCRRMWGPWPCRLIGSTTPPSYSLDPDFIFFPAESEEYGT